MSDLVEFLRARLDEDEAIARAAVAASDRLWVLDNDQLGRPWVYDSDNGSPLMEAIMGEGDREVLTHVVVHHPDRVLREVEAKRRIVSELTTERTVRKATERRGVYDSVIEAQPLDSWEAEVTVKALAAIYSDHPDYRDEWKP